MIDHSSLSYELLEEDQSDSFILLDSNVRKSRGMRSAKRPSPDRHMMLKSSHLHGMEKPVRSFKSFIRAIPRRMNFDKPLPPIPTEPPPRKTSSSSTLSTAPTRKSRLSLWEAPSSWDNNDSCRDQSTPPFSLREYSPLIPEPPEDIAAMQADPIRWQQGNGPFQQTPLDPIHERNAITPEVPLRNPSRISPTMPSPGMTRRNSRDILPSISSQYSTGTFEDGLFVETAEPSFVVSEHEGPPSPLDLVSALTDMSINMTAMVACGQDQGSVCDGQHQRSDFTQYEHHSHLDMQDSKLRTFGKGGVSRDHSSDTSEGVEVSDKMQTLMFAQDYHKFLANAGIGNNDRAGNNASTGTALREEDLTPQPLVWRKEADSSPPAEGFERPQLAPIASSGRHRNLKMMTSWVNHRIKRDQQAGPNQRSISDPGSTARLPGVDGHLKNEVRLSNIVQHGKEFVSRKILRRETEPASPLLISRPIPQPDSVQPAVAATPIELARPVLRLPGGLALVRQSPSALHPQTANDAPCSPLSDLSWSDFPVSSPFRRDFSRRGSTQSAESHPYVGSSSAHPPHFTSHLASPARMHFSHSTVSLPVLSPKKAPTTLSAIFKTPQTRRRSHNIGSPLRALPTLHSEEQHGPSSLENVRHRLNLFEKARHAHDAWRKHQTDFRNEKLKQSIRLVGPADASDIAGYIKCAVDGRASGDSGIGEGELEGRASRE